MTPVMLLEKIKMNVIKLWLKKSIISLTKIDHMVQLLLDQLYLGCLKMIYTCTFYPIQWELAKSKGHSVKRQIILH